MLARISSVLPTFILGGIAPLHGQDQPPSTDALGPIATDRPAVTNSSVVVPAGSLKVENGFLETSSPGQSVLGCWTSDDALARALDLAEDISVMHVFVDLDESSADDIWRLNSQERENLRKYLSSGLG
jgi:hypothetical protein